MSARRRTGAGRTLRNLVRDAPRTLGFAPGFLWKNRVARMRLPGFFLRNPARRYGLEYHAEHLPHPESRLTLSETVDRLGLPRLRIDLRFSEADAAAVLRAHDALDDWLAATGSGGSTTARRAEARVAAVLAEAKHGNHQVGTIRMGSDRRSAVVDGDCRGFDAAEPLRGLDRGAADLGPGQPDADRGAARPAAGRPAGRVRRVAGVTRVQFPVSRWNGRD